MINPSNHVNPSQSSVNTAHQLVHFISYLSASDRHWLHVDNPTRDDSIVCIGSLDCFSDCLLPTTQKTRIIICCV
jgi:hypothetical protein